MQNYGELKQLGSGIWVRDGEWYASSFRRRMTVMALPNYDLIVHNAFILKNEDISRLCSLGTVVGIVMPNALHGDEIGWMVAKFPQARVLVPSAALKKAKVKHRVTGCLERDWPEEWSSSIVCLPVEGLRMIHESAFYHKASRSLVLTDLVFNMKAEDFKTPIERKIMSWNRVGTGFGPSRLCDSLFTKDMGARRRSIATMLSWDFDRVIMSHGQVLESGGKATMEKAFNF